MTQDGQLKERMVFPRHRGTKGLGGVPGLQEMPQKNLMYGYKEVRYACMYLTSATVCLSCEWFMEIIGLRLVALHSFHSFFSVSNTVVILFSFFLQRCEIKCWPRYPWPRRNQLTFPVKLRTSLRTPPSSPWPCHSSWSLYLNVWHLKRNWRSISPVTGKLLRALSKHKQLLLTKRSSKVFVKLLGDLGPLFSRHNANEITLKILHVKGWGLAF